VIRVTRAVASDVEGIGAVVHEVWKLEILSDVCRAQIESDASALWVARNGDDVLGFVSAFLTRSRAGRRRWEIDLLAVRPASQGQGLGQRLIRRAWEDGERRGAALARAAIRVENLPSQKAFEKTGFSTDGRIHHLFLWDPQSGAVPHRSPDPVLLVSVETLTYRGLWIEGLERVSWSKQRLAVRTARARVASERRLNTGALVPHGDVAILAPDLRDQAHVQGRYCWFVRHSRVQQEG